MGDEMASTSAIAAARTMSAVRIPSSPSGWRHWTVYGWCVIVRSYEPSRIEVYDPQGHLVARARNFGRAMSWALAQRSTAAELA